jgi:hypothetical protein
MAHRTALITAGSIAAVLFAAAVAIGANLGILSVADSSPVGKLSAAAPVPSATKVEVYAGIGVSQQYVIRKAGTVTVALTKRGLRLVDVTARPHWRWTLAQTAQRKLTVTFRKPGVTYAFAAVVGHRHTILARVVHPITRVVTRAPIVSTSWSATPVARPPATSPAPARPAAQPTGGGDNSGGGGDD